MFVRNVGACKLGTLNGFEGCLISLELKFWRSNFVELTFLRLNFCCFQKGTLIVAIISLIGTVLMVLGAVSQIISGKSTTAVVS